MSARRVKGEVRIVGSGLLGASIGLGLRQGGVDVALHDASPTALSLAVDYGAGRPAAEGDDPALVVVAVPPDLTARVVAEELAAHPAALVVDVASVKAAPLAELAAAAGADLARYIGTHPLAGRERGGAISARADLFVGRPWVITAREGADPARLGLVEDLVLDLGAVPVEMSPEEHDRSVALTSHVPQVVASLLAKRLIGAPDSAVALAGQGLRDTVRIASSSPELWVQILEANAPAVAEVLAGFRGDLDALLALLADPGAAGSRRGIAEALEAGNRGVARIPGKHGQNRRFSQVVVMVDDRPGELARLLSEVGQIGVNLEDLRLEHSPGAPIGLAELSVLPEAEPGLIADLESRGWRIAGAWA